MNGRRWAGIILIAAVVVVGLVFVVQSVVVGSSSWRPIGLVVIGVLAGVYFWRQQRPGNGDE